MERGRTLASASHHFSFDNRRRFSAFIALAGMRGKLSRI
jgi:hypothetical protein